MAFSTQWYSFTRHQLTIGIVFTLALLTMQVAVNANAQPIEFPALTGRVVDVAGIIDAATEVKLTETLAKHEAETTNQIVVATIPSLGNDDIAGYANRLGRYWQIGSAEEDNGVLLLVAPTERKVRIEVGYGLEGALPDGLASLIIQREILPAFRSGDLQDGIQQGVTAILAAVAGEYTAPDEQDASESDPISEEIGHFLPLIFIAMVMVPEVLRRIGRRKAANGAFPAGFAGLFGTLATGNLFIGLTAALVAFLFIYFFGSGGGSGGQAGRGRYIGTGGGIGGGSFGGGGFSGGGGSFGGGGASGSW